MNTNPTMLSRFSLYTGNARVFLLPEQRAQLVKRRVGANRDHVGTRRHDLADERVAEVHDRLQQPPLVAFDQALFFAGLEVACAASPLSASAGGVVRLARLDRDRGGSPWR